jgi:2-succinyl-6-hydroxy-2,4-cyclohexadiene-1-carboxylate synthase
VKRLVLIHGYTGSPASFAALCRSLPLGTIRVLCPALLGHGPPVVVGSLQRFEQEVDRLAAEIRAAGFGGAHLCGYSLGARLALGLLARHPFLFRAATLVGVHPGLADVHERAARVGSDERWCALLNRAGVERFADAWQSQPLFSSQVRLPAHLLEQQRQIRCSHSACGLARALRSLGLGQMPDYRGVLGALGLPVELVVGSEDRKFSALAAEARGRNPRIRSSTVSGVGHNVLLEAPAQLARVLTKALDR